jgi:hypothetical protein
MKRRIEAAAEALKAAQKEGRKQCCLTDPDARMRAGGRRKWVDPGHSFEAGVDVGVNGALLVVGQTLPAAPDNDRLELLVEAARSIKATRSPG